MRHAPWLVMIAATVAACGSSEGGGAVGDGGSRGLGRTPAPAEIAAVDIDAAPDGHGLPPGRGTVAAGATLFQQKCQMCHGPKGEGMAPAYPPLIGRDSAGEDFRVAKDAKLPKTIGNYWSHATTVFDYVRRAMPHPAPGSLTNDEVYSLTAFLLAANKVIPENAVLDSASLVQVKMPYRDRFVPDTRRGGPEVR